ncbi:craniofacial development protein 1-like, partial [Scyliorhinus canicula]|uniref:craniofacial development protein 1-like n=1 Tax=Scyliorhinus canicula TaxID=7830 RepID=UPI0018F5B70F
PYCPHNSGRRFAEKKKADDLWANFLSDVGQKPKPVAITPTSRKEDILVDQEKLSKSPDIVKDSEKPKAPGKVKITKVFDFAGEEVKVTKEVDAASKEAKIFFKNQNEVQEKDLPAVPATVEVGVPTGSGVKRQSAIGNILGKMGGKKQKMSTLEKSKVDWEAFKEKEGIGDELAIYNRGKEGYIERKAFLDRVDHLLGSNRLHKMHRGYLEKKVQKIENCLFSELAQPPGGSGALFLA